MGVAPPWCQSRGLAVFLDRRRDVFPAYGRHGKQFALSGKSARFIGHRGRWVQLANVIRPVDEPQSAAEYAEVRTWGEIVHGVDPNVPLAVTEQPLPEDPSWGTIVGYCNDWIVHGSFLDTNREAIAERQAAGETVTWYVSCDQTYPHWSAGILPGLVRTRYD